MRPLFITVGYGKKHNSIASAATFTTRLNPSPELFRTKTFGGFKIS